MFQILKTKDISPDENQPRKLFAASEMGTLKESIKRHGIMSPITVEEISQGKYLLVDGGRRFRSATELGLKEVPAIVIKPQTKMERLIQQFHIQEQHQGWTMVEKAVAIADIADDLGIDSKKAAEMLGLSQQLANNYLAFSRLVNRDGFKRSNIDIAWANNINGLKKTVKSISEKVLEEDFDRNDEKKLEEVLVKAVKEGIVRTTGDMSKLKDAFKKDPKSIALFMKGDITPNALFVKTKAKGAYHLRNVVNNAGYIKGHVMSFLANPDVEVTKEQESILMTAKEWLDKMVKYIEKP